MLRLGKERPTAKRVALGVEAYIVLRTATSFEVDRATSATTKILFGLLAGEQAAMHASAILGYEFREADFTQKDWRSAAAARLALVELTALCADEWGGIGDDEGKPLAMTRENIALLLQDVVIARTIGGVVNARLYEEADEKNGLAVSPSGGAAADEPTAPGAAPMESLAPGGS